MNYTLVLTLFVSWDTWEAVAFVMNILMSKINRNDRHFPYSMILVTTINNNQSKSKTDDEGHSLIHSEPVN